MCNNTVYRLSVYIRIVYICMVVYKRCTLTFQLRESERSLERETEILSETHLNRDAFKQKIRTTRTLLIRS